MSSATTDINFQNDILPLKNELFRLALRITQNTDEAKDVVQDTMLKVWTRRDTWPQIESVEAFCLTICRNVALDRVRRMDHQTDTLQPDHDLADHSYAANPEQQAVVRDRVELVRRLIDQLPEKLRSCMQLRDIEGKSYRDIAQIMNINEQQVKTNIYRARQAVKAAYLKHAEA